MKKTLFSAVAATMMSIVFAASASAQAVTFLSKGQIVPSAGQVQGFSVHPAVLSSVAHGMRMTMAPAVSMEPYA